MLYAYIDESGHESDGWIFVAGYLGSESQWEDFIPKWRAGMGSKRLFLHMKKLRWKKDSTRRLLERLGSIPESCGLQGVMGGVRYSDYRDLVSGTKEEKLIKGYISCLYPLVIQTLRGTPREERIELIFEQQNEYEPFARMMLSTFLAPIPGQEEWLFTKNGEPRLAKCSFVPKGSTLMSDPADYLAFALREVWTDKTSKKSQWCKPILTAGDGMGLGSVMSRTAIRQTIMNLQTMMFWQGIQDELAKLHRLNSYSKLGL